jgi:hypothetical protein
MRRGLLVALSAVSALLLTATGAVSRPAAGINISAPSPDVSLESIDFSSRTATYSLAVSARWTPQAVHDDVRVTFVPLSKGGIGASPQSFYGEGNVLHSNATYRGAFGVFAGERLLITAKWHAETPQTGGTLLEGTKVSGPTVITVPEPEVRPRFTEQQKQFFRNQAKLATVLCIAAAAGGVIAAGGGIVPGAIAFFAMAGGTCALALNYWKLASDPPDPRFRVIAKPTTPPAPEVATGQGVSAAAAAAANRLLGVQAQEIGLMRAMLTAFDRAAGAYVKKQTTWERKQMVASGGYAAQLATLIQSEIKLRASARAAFTTPLPVTTEQAYAFGNSLVGKQLPGGLTAALAKLGLSKDEREEVRRAGAVIDPSLYDGNATASIANPELLSGLRKTAAAMKAFAKTVKKNPLETRPP